MAAAIVEYSRLCFPAEACGLVAGDEHGLRMVYCLTNADDSPSSYTIDPAEHFGALRHAERNGWELVGAFHSHPHGPAAPSATDLARAAEPDWLWIVVGRPIERPELRGYRIRDGLAAEEHLLVGR